MQWESIDVLRMPEAKRLSHFSDDGNFAFIEGSETGIPAEELIVVDAHPDSAGETTITTTAATGIESVDSISPDKPVAESGTDIKSATSASSPEVAAEPEVDVSRMDIDQLKRRTKLLGPNGKVSGPKLRPITPPWTVSCRSMPMFGSTTLPVTDFLGRGGISETL